MTSIAASRRAPTVIVQPTGQPQVTAKTLSLEELMSDSGVTSLLRKMDKKFGLDTVTLLHNNISDFFEYSWDKHVCVKEFFVGFQSRLDKINRLNLNDWQKRHPFLEPANLDTDDLSIVPGAASGDYSH